MQAPTHRHRIQMIQIHTPVEPAAMELGWFTSNNHITASNKQPSPIVYITLRLFVEAITFTW